MSMRAGKTDRKKDLFEESKVVSDKRDESRGKEKGKERGNAKRKLENERQ